MNTKNIQRLARKCLERDIHPIRPPPISASYSLGPYLFSRGTISSSVAAKEDGSPRVPLPRRQAMAEDPAFGRLGAQTTLPKPKGASQNTRPSFSLLHRPFSRRRR